MRPNKKNSVSYQFISRKAFDGLSDSLTASNYYQSIPKGCKFRPQTSAINRISLGFGINKGNNYMTKQPHHYLEKYNIRYLPKRKIRNNFLAPPTIESSSSSMPIKSQEPIELKSNKKKELKYQDNVNETCNSKNDYLKVRTGYILKFASNSDFFNKTKKYFDYLSEDKQGTVNDLYDNLNQIYDLKNRIYFDKINCGGSFSYDTWKDLLRNSNDYTSLMLKLIDVLFRELKNDKDTIIRLKKRNFELENQITSKTNEITLINDFIKKNDLNQKLTQKKQKSITTQELKQTYIQKENAYILTIYRLEDEIKGLSSLLEKNKQIDAKIEKSKEKAEKRKQTMDEMRLVYSKEINELTLRNSIIKDERENLKEQVDQLENAKKTMLVDIENVNTTLFEVNKRNQMYKKVIEQRSEIINMLYEESYMYKYLYETEKKEHLIKSNKLLKFEEERELLPKL